LDFIRCCVERDRLEPEAKQVVTEYIEGFLGVPRAEQGRPERSAFPVGAHVCPFVRGSLEHGLTSVIQLAGVTNIERVTLSVRDALDGFPTLEPTQGKKTADKVILLIYPDIPPDQARKIIDVVQATEKPSFVAQGMMIGQFHPFSDEPGVYNAAFRPLRSPFPMIAIRKIVPEDHPFLIGPGTPPDQRVLNAKAWLRACKEWDPEDYGTSRARNVISAVQVMLGELGDEFLQI
jgi:hypothetical protein